MSIRTSGRPVLIAALVTALAVAGCSRALPTAPATPSDAGSTTPLRSALGQLTPVAGQAVGLVKRTVQDPGFVVDPGDPVLPGALQYVPIASRLVKPDRESSVSGGRWTLDFHPGSLSAAATVTIALASDGTMKVQFGPDGTQFGAPVDLTINYAGTVLDPSTPRYQPGLLPQFLYFDPALGQWVEMASDNDVKHNRLQVHLQHFSTYGLGSKAGW